MRAITAEEAAPRAMAGRIRCQIVPFPPAGNHFRWTENTSINKRPNQKMGMEMPKRAPTMLILSKREYCRVEEITPAMSPMKAAIRMDRKESWRVKRNRSLRRLITGSRLRMEIPKSPRTTWEIKWKYWM